MTHQVVPVYTSGKTDLRAKRFRFSLAELGGSLGDLGTLVPLAVTLIVINKMSPAAVFLIVGLLYVGAGLYYGVPVPVQPLKAVSAIAISLGLAPRLVSTSGLVIGALLMLLSLTGLMNKIAKLFSKPVIRGIQLGVALLLIKSGLGLMLKPQLVINGQGAMLDIVHARVPLSLLTAVGAIVVLAYFLTSERFPASLAVLAYGAGVSLLFELPAGLSNIEFSLVLPHVQLPTAGDLSTALILLVIPQIPLTLGNAVVATSDVARLYFGKRAGKVTYKALPLSMGLANIAAGLLGGMPVCHGSGGLTAHYRFGARTGGANLMIGAICLILAVFFSQTILPILSLIPYPILGVLLAFVGIQHSLLIRDVAAREDLLVAVFIAVVGMLTGNLAIGFGLGLVIYHGLNLLKAHGRDENGGKLRR